MSRAITQARGQRHGAKRAEPALPFGMEGRAGAAVEGDDPHTALMRELNYFPTPPWAARAGGELIRRLDPAAEILWEPACGEGHAAGPLSETFRVVLASDIHPHGFNPLHDFLSGDHGQVLGPDLQPDWIITNPPFAKAEAFVMEGLKVARRGVAMLCRLAFIESVGRYGLMQRLALHAPFSERVPMQLGSWDPDLSSATAYAWFLWLQPGAIEASPLRAAIAGAWSADAVLTSLIPPGTCARLTRPDDRVRYAGEAPCSQLELL